MSQRQPVEMCPKTLAESILRFGDETYSDFEILASLNPTQLVGILARLELQQQNSPEAVISRWQKHTIPVNNF